MTYASWQVDKEAIINQKAESFADRSQDKENQKKHKHKKGSFTPKTVLVRFQSTMISSSLDKRSRKQDKTQYMASW